MDDITSLLYLVVKLSKDLRMRTMRSDSADEVVVEIPWRTQVSFQSSSVQIEQLHRMLGLFIFCNQIPFGLLDLLEELANGSIGHARVPLVSVVSGMLCFCG
jgi:hypothetical protein